MAHGERLGRVRGPLLGPAPGRPAADICLRLDEDLGYGLPSRTATAFPGFDFLSAYPPDLEAMQMQDGTLVHPTAGSFRVIVTPQARTAHRWVARLATVEKLATLVRQGAWLVGPPPAAPAGLRDLERHCDFDRAVAAVWGTTPIEREGFRSVGQGRVFAADAGSTQVLRDHAIQPAVSCSPAEAGLRWIRRDLGEGSLYFIQLFGGGPERIEVTFREQGLQPEVWGPLTGARADAPKFPRRWVAPIDGGTEKGTRRCPGCEPASHRRAERGVRPDLARRVRSASR